MLENAGKQSFDAARRKALHNIVMDDVTAAGKEDLAKRAKSFWQPWNKT